MNKEDPQNRRDAAQTAATKKAALLYIFKILSEQTDRRHRLTQKEIGVILKERYGIELERKAISNNLEIIRNAGFEIDSTHRGTRLLKEFEDYELAFLIECVRSNPSLPEKHAQDLIDKIEKLSAAEVAENAPAPAVPPIGYHQRNPHYVLNVAGIRHAVATGKKISFTYNSIGADNKLYKEFDMTCAPYGLIMRSGVLWLIASIEALSIRTRRRREAVVRSFRVDRLTDVTVLEADAYIPESSNPPSAARELEKASAERPFMEPVFFDAPEDVRFICPASRIGAALECFGTSVTVEKLPPLPKSAINTPAWRMDGLNERMVRISAKATKHAVTTFSILYGPYVYVEEPAAFRENVEHEMKFTLAVQGALSKLFANDPAKKEDQQNGKK